MGIIRTESNEDVLFFLRLDPLGDNEDVTFVRITDNMSEQAFVTRVLINSPNVFHIDFDIVRREIEHSGEVRVIGSEIVDRDFATERFELVSDSDHEFAFGRVDAFENFENDFRWPDVERTQRFPYEIHEREIGDVVGRDVYGELCIRVGKMCESLFDHDAGNGPEMPSLFRGGQEFAWSEYRNGIGRIVHSDKTLNLFYRGSERGVVVDFLIERYEKIFLESVFHEGNHLETFAEKFARNARRIEKYGGISAFSGLMERHVRTHEHFLTHRTVGYDTYGKQEGHSRISMDDFYLVEVREELFDGFSRRAFRTNDGEIGTFQLVRFPALIAKQSRKSTSHRDKDVVSHFRSIGVVHLNHVVHVYDGQCRKRVRFQIFHELVAIRESGLKIDHRSGTEMRMTETFEFGNVMTDDLKRGDLSVFHNGRYDRMEPKQASILRLFANVPFPYLSRIDGIPKTFPKTLVVESRMENGHVFSDELAFGISGNFKQSAVYGNDDSRGIGFYGRFVTSKKVDDRKEPRFFLADFFDVLFE